MRYFLTALLLLTPMGAQAIIVKNLTDETKRIEFSRTSSDARSYEIIANDSIVINGVGRIRMAGDTELGYYCYNRDRFVIWPEEGLVHQQRMKKGGR